MEINIISKSISFGEIIISVLLFCIFVALMAIVSNTYQGSTKKSREAEKSDGLKLE